MQLSNNLMRTMEFQYKSLQTTGIKRKHDDASSSSGDDIADDSKPGGKVPKAWTTLKEAKFCGWANVAMHSEHLPAFFRKLTEARADDKEALITALFDTLAKNHDAFSDFEVHSDLIEDLKKGNYAPHLNAAKWHRGLGPMAFADRDVAELDRDATKRDREQYARLTYTTSDLKAMESSIQLPPQSFEKMMKYWNRWAIFMKITLGARSKATKDIAYVLQELQRLHRRAMRSPTYVQHRIPSIMWEATVTAKDFWQTITLPEAFKKAEDEDRDYPNVPMDFSPDVISLASGQAADLPLALQTVRPSNEGTNKLAGTAKVSSNHNATNSRMERTNSEVRHNQSWHPMFKADLDGKNVIIQKLAEEASINIAWIQRQLGTGRDDCIRYHLLGICSSPTCNRKHGQITVPDNVASQVMSKIKPHIAKAIRTTRNE